MTTTISVAAEFEAKIREKVESGQYESTDAVLAEALRLLDQHEQNQETIERLRELIDEGFEGPFTPLTREAWDAGLARVRERYFAAKSAAPDATPVDASS